MTTAFEKQRKQEKEIWQFIKPVLDLPPSTDVAGASQWRKAQRLIQEAVKDPIFVKRMEEHKATLKEMLMKDFDSEVFAKLFDTDMRALVYEKGKK